MAVIELTTTIAAPIERVFDLSCSIDLHTRSTARTGEQAVAGITSGLIGPGQEVTWRARHFGIWQTLTSGITEWERPTHFADVMVRGAFRRMEHHHYFETTSTGTTMRDIFAFESPLGWLGHLANALFLTRYMRTLLFRRNAMIRLVAESDEWRQYLRGAS